LPSSLYRRPRVRARRLVAAAGVLASASSMVGVGAATSLAQSTQPPMIVFVTETLVNSQAVQVEAAVTPGSAATSVSVHYGPAPRLSATTSAALVQPAPAPVQLKWSIGGLRPGVTYAFQVVATSSAGAARSGVDDVTVPKPGSAPHGQAPPTAPGPPEPTSGVDIVSPVTVQTGRAAFSALNRVSCPTATFCLAVGVTGSSVTHLRPLVERFSGSALSQVASAGSWGTALSAVACRSIDFCIAVGNQGDNAWSERWDGHGWRVLATPSPRVAGGDELADVACTVVDNCLAVGYENAGTKDYRPLIEHWDGRSWSVVPVAAAETAALATPESVSCSSTGDCVVVGVEKGPTRLGRPFVSSFDGKSLVPVPTASMGGQLFSVSCARSVSCFAVGIGEGGTSLFLHLTKGSWQVVPGMSRSGDGNFDAVACPSTSECVAAGAMTARWDGQSWSIGQSATVSGTGAPPLSVDVLSLACPTPTKCLAVGERGGRVQHAVADLLQLP
jgi:hypothetical protein